MNEKKIRSCGAWSSLTRPLTAPSVTMFFRFNITGGADDGTLDNRIQPNVLKSTVG